MKIFYDTEFIENGATIDLVSIGLVADDGREFYAVSSEFSVTKLHADPWLIENVRPSLPGRDTPGCRCIARWHLDRDHPDVRSRAHIAGAVEAFVRATPDVELWADYGAYDHVALCQLYGRMIDLPPGFPMWTHDFQQAHEAAGRLALPEQAEGLHNALADARHLRDQFAALAEAALAVEPAPDELPHPWLTDEATALMRARPCKSCGRPFSPSHDINAPGPTVRHPFAPAPKQRSNRG